jgi:Tol biopolymer transport system component
VLLHRAPLLALLTLLPGCWDEPPADPAPQERTGPVFHEPFPGERHLANLKQLTFGGENAEAYWSYDEKRLVFQSTRDGYPTDRIYTMDADGGNLALVGPATGRSTCAWFCPGDERILFASTHAAGDDPRPTPRDRSLGYVWPVWSQYDIYTAKADGSDLRPLIECPGYDAEATISPTGDRIVFTSGRDGDLEVYTAALDGSDIRRVTRSPGYDGGAVFSWDGTRIAWRAVRPEGEALEEDRRLLAQDLVRPSRLDLWTARADGTEARRLTDNGAANFGPFWHPDGKRILFSSNLHDPNGFNFELYLIEVETGVVERVTHFERKIEGSRWSDDFDGFPMFTRDGKRLVFCSNRHNAKSRETNVFTADWVD